MLKLKLQYFAHLMQRVDSLEKTLMLGGIEGRRRRVRQRMRWLDGITDSMDLSLSELLVTFRYVHGYLLNLKASSWNTEHCSYFLSRHHRALPAQDRATGRRLLINSMGQLPRLIGISHRISLGESLTLTVGSHWGASLSKNLKTHPL